MKKKIFISHKFFEEHIREKLSDFEVEFWEGDKAPSPGEFADFSKGAFGILSMLSNQIDSNIIGALVPELKIISNYAVGYNNIDISSAHDQGVVVTNTPDVLTDAVAELVIGMMIALGRNFELGLCHMREGLFKGWGPEDFIGRQIKGSTVGIVGMGRIGQAIAKRLVPFGCKLIYSNRTKKPDLEKELSLTKCKLDKLVGQSDYIILALGLTEDTHHTIDKKHLALMKKYAFLINIGRGALIDEKELIVALEKRQIGGAALDVYEQEPFVPDELLRLRNVLLLPHIGSATDVTRLDMLELALSNIIAVSKGKDPLTPVIPAG